MSILEENTLGVVVGRARKAVGTTAKRFGSGPGANLGVAFLGTGALVLVGLRLVYGLAWFGVLWNGYPAPLLSLGAWVLLMSAITAAMLVARISGDRLPTWAFLLFVAGLAAAVVLDIVAVWPLGDIGRTATVASAAGFALLAVITLRSRLEILVTAAALSVVIGAAMFLGLEPGTEIESTWLSAQLTTLAMTLLPAAIGVVLVEGFRGLVQIELDRVMVQSTVSAPRFAVGMLASEELARLDLAAEELFDRIADGRTELPLHPKTASVAASLATELRLHLIEGRRETWLYHAISESEMLGKRVTLTDKSSLAGLLDPNQRDGLLATAWLLVGDSRGRDDVRRVSLQVGPVDPEIASPVDGKIAVPILLTSTGITRNRVDPAVWDAIARVGKYADSTHDSSLRVDIVCLVDNPAEV